MRIWSLHPRHLDRIGLVALWREALLAQAVLAGRTRGYRDHPQLVRFRAHDEPDRLIGAYLAEVQAEAARRGYRFDATKIDRPPAAPDADGNRPGSSPLVIAVTQGQLAFERAHLLAKLEARSPGDAGRLEAACLEAHPILLAVPGGIAAWERGGRS